MCESCYPYQPLTSPAVEETEKGEQLVPQYDDIYHTLKIDSNSFLVYILYINYTYL